jgi:hypothetical protein
MAPSYAIVFVLGSTIEAVSIRNNGNSSRRLIQKSFIENCSAEATLPARPREDAASGETRARFAS